MYYEIDFGNAVCVNFGNADYAMWYYFANAVDLLWYKFGNAAYVIWD